MHPAFKEWVISSHEKMPADSKANFIPGLKTRPDIVLSIIRGSILEWTTAAVFQTGCCMIFDDLDQLSQEILEAFQEHFVKEIAAAIVPQQVSNVAPATA